MTTGTGACSSAATTCRESQGVESAVSEPPRASNAAAATTGSYDARRVPASALCLLLTSSYRCSGKAQTCAEKQGLGGDAGWQGSKKARPCNMAAASTAGAAAARAGHARQRLHAAPRAPLRPSGARTSAGGSPSSIEASARLALRVPPSRQLGRLQGLDVVLQRLIVPELRPEVLLIHRLEWAAGGGVYARSAGGVGRRGDGRVRAAGGGAAAACGGAAPGARGSLPVLAHSARACRATRTGGWPSWGPPCSSARLPPAGHHVNNGRAGSGIQLPTSGLLQAKCSL